MATKKITPGREGYKILFSTNTIIMNYKFAAAAAKYGTNEYNILKDIRADFPNMAEVVMSGREKKKARKNSRVTYENMKKHISVYKNSEELMNQFELIKAASKPCASPYKYVYDWFVKQFPHYNDSSLCNFENQVLSITPAPNTDEYKLREEKQAAYRKGKIYEYC